MQVAARAQALHLVDQAVGQHRLKALGNPFVQPGPLLGFKRNQQPVRRRRCLACVQRRHGLSGKAADFQGPLYALRIGRVEPGCGGWVKPREFGVQRCPALGSGLRL